MNEDFKDYVLKQLRYVEGVRCLRMFRNGGLYVSEDLFGIIVDATLYFRTDKFTRVPYRRLRMKALDVRDPLHKKFYEVPPQVIKSRRALARWAREAIAIHEPVPDQRVQIANN